MHVSSLGWIDSFLRVIKKFLRAFEICTAIPLYYSIGLEYDSLYRSHIRRSILRFPISLQLFSMFRISNRLPRFITHMQTESFDRYSR